MQNLNWLFGAFALAWALVFLYLFWLSRKEQALRRRVRDLEQRMP